MDALEKSRLRARLDETRAWLMLEQPFAIVDGLVERTSRLCVDDLWAAEHTEEAALLVFERREQLVRAALPKPTQTAASEEGRVALIVTTWNLLDGFCAVTSCGFFTECNMPPCDTWIDLVEKVSTKRHRKPVSLLLFWVPAPLVGFAQEGIDCNPEQCLAWADEFSADVADVFRE